MHYVVTPTNQKLLFFIGAFLILLFFSDHVLASTAGGGLPYEGWFKKITNSITGPFAYTVSIVGLVSAGSMLIFGSDMNGFMRTLVFIVLVLSFIVAAQNTLTGITGKGAEITHDSKESS